MALLGVVLAWSVPAFAQSDDSTPALPVPLVANAPAVPVAPATVSRDDEGRATVRAVRASEPFRIDGVLDETHYGRVPAMSGFVQIDPTPGAPFSQLCEVALLVRDTLVRLGMKPIAKTTGSRGIHVYVAIRRGPTQKEVWTFAKAIARILADEHPKLITAEYRVAKRPRRRVLVDYNQNAWGRTLASVYSVRPKPLATVSAPVTWEEVARGLRLEDFVMDTVRQRVRTMGDLWRPLLAARGRARLERVL